MHAPTSPGGEFSGKHVCDELRKTKSTNMPDGVDADREKLLINYTKTGLCVTNSVLPYCACKSQPAWGEDTWENHKGKRKENMMQDAEAKGERDTDQVVRVGKVTHTRGTRGDLVPPPSETSYRTSSWACAGLGHY